MYGVQARAAMGRTMEGNGTGETPALWKMRGNRQGFQD